MIRLTSVDLPTLGRPTTASTGTGPGVVASGVGSNSGSCVFLVSGPGPRGRLGTDYRDRPRERRPGGPSRQREERRGCSADRPRCVVPQPGSGTGVLPPVHRSGRYEVESGRSGPRASSHQRDDLVDDLVQGVRRGVDVDGAVGHRQRRGGPAGVDRVAARAGRPRWRRRRRRPARRRGGRRGPPGRR